MQTLPIIKELTIDVHMTVESQRDELLKLLKEINYCFYVKGTSKDMKEVMLKTKPLIKTCENSIKGEQ